MSSATKETKRRWYEKNRARILADQRARTQALAAEDPDFWRKRHFKRRYGLDLEQVEAMWRDQGGCCAACGDAIELGKTTHLDHCHETNEVRAVLCQMCNQALGLLKDDPERIRALLAYVELWVKAFSRST